MALRHYDPVKLALTGFTVAVIGTFANAYQVSSGWLAPYELIFQAMLVGCLMAGLAFGVGSLLVAFAVNRVPAVLPVVVMGALLTLALTELGAQQDDTNYFLAIVPVLAGVLTAWAFAAFRAPARRPPLHDRLLLRRR